MNSFEVGNLKPDTYYSDELVLDSTFLVLGTTLPVTKELIIELNSWGFKEVLSNGHLGLASASNSTVVSEQQFEKDFSDAGSSKPLSENSSNESLKRALQEVQGQNSEKTRLSAVQNVYNEYMTYINTVYTHYATHQELNIKELSDTVNDLCIFVRDNKRYVLRIQPSQEIRSKNFLVSHSMRSTVLSLAIGLRLHMPLDKLINLGVACILHEIGMLKLPPQLYLTDRLLTPSEKTKLHASPIEGYKILKEANFPLSIQMAVLQHSERENGMGYPQHLISDKINSYAKIIAVACSFEAISAPRRYREAHTTFEAMVELLKNENKQYDGNVIKALLYSLSFYPIGAYVFLKNGKIGQVTDVNPETPKFPIVQIVGEKAADGDPRTIQTDDNNNQIDRVLTKQEAADVLKALGPAVN
jgi:HD-GYP domain-containing protein (c-di-GMP phosphodiesterase class II)